MGSPARRARSALGISCVTLTLAACSQPVRETADPGSSRERAAPTSEVPSVAAAPQAELGPPVSELLERPLLEELERAGLDLGTLLGSGEAAPNNAKLLQFSAWSDLVQTLRRDLVEIEQSDPAAGVSVARFSHRLFDVAFLTASSARFRLVGVTSRLDRRPFDSASCGETRLVYRLEYTDPRMQAATALPVTLALEYLVPAENQGACSAAAQRWQLSEASQRSPAELAVRLRGASGPLAPGRVAPRRFLQLVVNLQSVRWPSAVRPQLGGHAEYVLRAFRFEGAALVPRKLENTPDLARLKNDSSLRKALLALLSSADARAQLEHGSLLLPERFLAERVSSVTPRGLSRRQNRPFRSLFSAEDFAGLTFAGPRVLSAEAYVRRLDELSCAGCHQTRSIAGFHLLGHDATELPAGAALDSGVSPHLAAEMARRRRLTLTWLAGSTPDESVPFAERSREGDGGYGEPCGLGDPSFGSWTCAAGFVCKPYDAPMTEQRLVGICLPEQAETGDPCEAGPVRVAQDSHLDGTSGVKRTDCGSSRVCNVNAVGFPGGMCTGSCGSSAPEQRCATIAQLEPFNACLARAEPFDRCVREHSKAAGLRACSLESPCRDDYACARSAEGGVCLPPYFLFPLRVDGHRSPVP